MKKEKNERIKLRQYLITYAVTQFVSSAPLEHVTTIIFEHPLKWLLKTQRALKRSLERFREQAPRRLHLLYFIEIDTSILSEEDQEELWSYFGE